MLTSSPLVPLVLVALPLAACSRPGVADEAGWRIAVASGSYREIAPDELRGMLERKDFPLINVHVPDEGTLPQTDAAIPYNEIAARVAELPADCGARIVLYCRTGRMSAEAATALVGLGYRDVSHLAGGMEAWRARGYPLLDTPAC